MRTAPEVYPTRAVADKALWAMATDGRADTNHDSRYRALVLLATFASLRWNEATALRRCDVDNEQPPHQVRLQALVQPWKITVKGLRLRSNRRERSERPLL